MMMTKEAQIEFGRGEPIDDAELLRALRTRDQLRSAASMYRKVAKEVNQKAEPHLLDGQQHECGEFLLRGSRMEEGHREYDIKASYRVYIKKMKGR